MLSLSALFIYACYHSTPLPSASTHPLSFLPNPHPSPSASKFTFTIKVLAFDRLASLSRCLKSLAAADYGRDKVDLHIYIDHFDDDIVSGGGAILGQKLENSHEILAFVDGFCWKYGDKLVHYRTRNAGLQAQWLEAWWPASDDDFAFVVEDDLEVSPLYYKFLRRLIDHYYYNASNFSPSIYGASLQRPRFVPGKHGNKLQLDPETHLFLYHLVGTWGQLLFPKQWKEFRLWYDTHKTKGIKPILQGMVTTGWYKKMGERIWTPWFIKFIHSRGYFNIYTNFLRERALSVSHRDAGVNYGKTAGPDSYLVDEASIDSDHLEMQPLRNLKWYDFCFREVHPERVIQSFDELGPALDALQKQKTVIFVSLFRASKAVIKNLLCHFERLNIQNYILVGLKSSFLLDLARRGHPVIDVDRFLDSIKAYRSFRFREGNVGQMKEIIVNAFAINKCLEFGFHSWIMDADTVLVGSDPPFDINTPSFDFYAGEAMELLFVRGSLSARKIWSEDFIDKAVDLLKSLIVGDSSPIKFVNVVTNLLERNGARFKRVDEKSFGIKIDAGNVNKTTSVEDKHKLVFWSPELRLNMIQKRLEDLGMWVIDGDFSCTAVFCHLS